MSRAGFLRGNPHPQHLRMTVFGDRNFKEVIKHNWGCLGGALTQSNGYLDKKRMCGCRETPGARMCPRREDHMRTQQEAGRPQAKERDGPRRRLYQHHIVTKIPSRSFPPVSWPFAHLANKDSLQFLLHGRDDTRGIRGKGTCFFAFGFPNSISHSRMEIIQAGITAKGMYHGLCSLSW